MKVRGAKQSAAQWQKDYDKASYKNQQSIGETSEKHRKRYRTDLNDTQIRILELLSVDAYLSAAKMAKRLGMASRNVEANIKKLKEKGILIRHGFPKTGYWEIKKDQVLVQEETAWTRNM